MKKKDVLLEARKLMSSKIYFESIVLLSKFIKKNNKCFEAIYLRGVAKNELGFYFYAIEDFKKCLDLNSSFYLALESKAYSEYKVYSYYSAIRDCELSIKFGNYNFFVYYVLGSSHSKISNYEEAY